MSFNRILNLNDQPENLRKKKRNKELNNYAETLLNSFMLLIFS